MIRAIIFDCFGVLTGDSWKEFLATLPSAVREDVRSVHRTYDKGFISYEDFRNQAHTISGADKKDLDAIFLHTIEHHKNSQLLDHIQQLHETYKIGILSNVGTAWIRDTFLTTQEQSYFDDMVLSFEVGLSKPDAQIYQLACKRLDVKPTQTVFIDDLEPFCRAAQDLGMKTVQYDNFAQYFAELASVLADAD